jgi:hypothetical protein
MTNPPRLTVLGTGHLGTTHAACTASLEFEANVRRNHQTGHKLTVSGVAVAERQHRPESRLTIRRPCCRPHKRNWA